MDELLDLEDDLGTRWKLFEGSSDVTILHPILLGTGLDDSIPETTRLE